MRLGTPLVVYGGIRNVIADLYRSIFQYIIDRRLEMVAAATHPCRIWTYGTSQ